MLVLQQLPLLCSQFCVILLLQTLTAESQECQPECHVGHGICLNGGCFCHSPWGGDDCSSLVSGSVDTVRQPTRPRSLTSAQLDDNPNHETLAPESFDSGHEDLPAALPLSFPGTVLSQPLVSMPTDVANNLQSQAVEVQPKASALPADLSGPAGTFIEKELSAIPAAPMHIRTPTQLDNVQVPLAADLEPKALLSVSSSSPMTADDARFTERTPVAVLTDSAAPTHVGRIKSMKPHRDKRRYRVVSSAGENDESVSSQRRLQYLEMPGVTAVDKDLVYHGHLKNSSGTKFLKRGSNSALTNFKNSFVSNEVCYFLPAGVQVGALAMLLLFYIIGSASTRIHDRTRKAVESSWTCSGCLCMGHCLVGMNWRTVLFGICLTIFANFVWVYMCYIGAAQQYMEQAAFFLYAFFVVMGAFTLLVMELYYRYGKERVDKVRDLENKVEELVKLLRVQYKQALDKGKDWGDDVTDFLMITEASSDDDITCMEAIQCKGPSKREIDPNKKKKKKEQMTKS
mmetsp:Transcript_13445/g.22136  ORF Transcript_13445/g.22136 Transcript_13445/m.22136 type:complete len:514 (+) Transcript_13445:105-1646(+)